MSPQIRLLGLLCVLSTAGMAEDTATILGPSNTALQEGADALRAGDAEQGVRLSLLGLSQASSARERQTAQSNLCAGYALLELYEQGLAYCDAVIEANEMHWRARSNRALIYIKLRRFEDADADLLVGEKIRPGSRTLLAVRRMYLDATNPVSPSVVIDDRRDSDIKNDDAN